MRILYLIQTFKNQEQIYRLVQIIKKSSPESIVLISHDFTASDLAIGPLINLSEVEILRLNGKGGRGDFSMIQGYLDALEWAFSHNIEFDWLINLSGQDYPTQPLPLIEKFLAETEYDGFLQYFDALSDSERNPWGVKETRDRYFYQYWRSGVSIPPNSLFSKIVNRVVLGINNIQPLIRLCWLYDCIMVGVSANSRLFNEKFSCYGGSYYHTLSKKCVQYLYNFSQENPDFVEYYKNTICPNESYVQTVLINSGLFNLCNSYKRYIKFLKDQDGSHPRTLTSEDYPTLIKDDIHFARKFEPAKDSRILDTLEARILQDG